MKMGKIFLFMENDISMFSIVYPEPIKTPLAMYHSIPFLSDRTNFLQRVMSATPVSPSKQPSRAPSRAAPSRPPSVARSVPPQRSDSRLANNAHHQTYTNPQTPGKARR